MSKRRVGLALVGAPTALLLVALWTAMASPSAVVEAQAPSELTVVIGTTDEVTSLDPADDDGTGSWEILYNVASGLLSFVPGTSELAPGLATAMPEVSPDGLVYTFTLRSGLQFPDGTAFNASAVKNSIDRVMQHGAEWAKGLVADYVSEVKTPGPSSVVFTLKNPTAFFPALVALPPYYPVSIGGDCFDLYYLDPECTCGGIGPYTIVSWDPGVSLELQANPDYYGPPPETPHIFVRYYSTAAELREALEDDEVDVAWRSLTTQDYLDFELQPDFEVVESDGGLIRYLAFNTTDTLPFNNANIRRAIAASVDRESIAQQVFTDSMTSLYSMVPQGMWSHENSFFDLYGQRNLTETRSLLAAAGYGDTDELTIGTTDDVRSLDPADAYTMGDAEVLYNVASGLLSYVPGTTELTPGLATAMPQVSPDGLVYTFTLRSGLKFPDDTDFDAYAVTDSISRVMEYGGDVQFLVTDFVSRT